MTTAALLALFAGVLAWPVPRLLSAARWPHRCPRAAIVLWQAIGLAGGVSALLAAVAFTVSPLSHDTPTAVADHLGNIAAGSPLSGLGWINLVGLGAAAALASRLFGVLGTSTAATLRDRHRHRDLVDLAGRRHRGHGSCTAAHSAHRSGSGSGSGASGAPLRSGTGRTVEGGTGCAGAADRCLCEHRDRAGIWLRVLDHPIAVAYCVPGVRHARVVVSRGLLNTLDPDELDAVLAHEAAHVAGRHDLVIQPFVAWERTFPFLRPAREATTAVCLLVEMLADDAAARETSHRTLARALARLGVTRAPVPSGALGITGAPGTVLPVLGVQAFQPSVAVRRLRGTEPVRSDPDAEPSVPGAPGKDGTFAPGTVEPGSVEPGSGGAGSRGQGGTDSGRGRPEQARRRRATANPVVTRVARLLDPPDAPWWMRPCAYLAAAVVLAAPPLIVLIG